jgi:hypothetical protein
MNSVYNYATGLGPLAYRLDKNDLKRMLPPARKSVSVRRSQSQLSDRTRPPWQECVKVGMNQGPPASPNPKLD